MDSRIALPLVVSLFIVFVGGALIGNRAGGRQHKYHTEWCLERLAHASLSDSLAVYQDDDFCLEANDNAR